MKRTRFLLVGLEYKKSTYDDAIIETRGLCSPEVCQTEAAAPLYEYDVVIINPKSYSHFIFGHETEFSSSKQELRDLKMSDNSYDIDAVFNWRDRQAEMEAAVKQGTKFIWLAVEEKRINFYGWRSLYDSYLNSKAKSILNSQPLYRKKSSKLFITSYVGVFNQYFERLTEDGWSICWGPIDEYINLAKTPEGYCLGCEVLMDNYKGWLLTPPTSELSVETLIKSAINLQAKEAHVSKYHGIFLSHNHEDKPFVRRLKESLFEHGVENVWIDEAEIMIGDSLIRKIEEGINKTEYFGIILSSRSVNSPWVQRELEQAMSIEIDTKQVKVLPLLYEHCELPGFLKGKMYADFTTPEKYNDSIDKLLRKLEMTATVR